MNSLASTVVAGARSRAMLVTTAISDKEHRPRAGSCQLPVGRGILE